MSQFHSLHCPCWDPWKIGCKRLVRTRAGTLTQKPKLKFSCRTNVQPLRSREPRDISKEFEDEIVPGFTLSHSKERIGVTLGEEFFEKKSPVEETVKPVVLSTPPKLETEDIIADLVEQISELTAMMEQLSRDHQTTHKQMEKDMEEKCNEMQEEHENKMREINSFHAAEMNALEEQYKKELRNERATAQEKLGGMQKEYKYLKNAFRVYQDSISDEMEEKWLRRQAEWKKSERTEREKALLQQKQSLTRKFEMEIEEQKKIIQNNSFLIGRVYEQEREEFQKQQQDSLDKIAELNKKVETLEAELKEKNETLDAIASSLHNTEMELQNEKANTAEMEKSIQQRIASIEEKHRINISSLVEENVILRRKLIRKNEEIFNQRAHLTGSFETFD
ncbi:flagellum-associated coiled-coil domain-containing protein 1 [Rhineura floridana]|uniref:flagellum-associated coiled-coil domain-containing protein 1 n=1 Tax=Rhineura floridana TaxID=261503 RepID=UPI002AC7F031|nr:flagellum-associated coiled-coil domain-containing protein 1 [Rhineura floridana]XP_061463991.1 flagellum-associated coiled-coil domain-containing protein 1 [Rhineura floridana]